MSIHEYGLGSTRQRNQIVIAQDDGCKGAIDEMRDVEAFLADFGLLTFGRDYIFCGKHPISLQMISTSLELTVGSIISCCESGCIADAYSLLRKYRDDMFFYLYVVVESELTDVRMSSEELNKVDQWRNNNLSGLNIGNVLKAIRKLPQIDDAVQRYHLEQYFEDLRNKLNNYVHSNGVDFYNQSVIFHQEESIRGGLEALIKDMLFITMTFLFLLTLCRPLSIMSADHIDYLECNMIPKDDSPYYVAPFITSFFKKNSDLIDENCVNYLQDNTSMIFD